MDSRTSYRKMGGNMQESGQVPIDAAIRPRAPVRDRIAKARLALLWAVLASVLLALLPLLVPGLAWLAWPQRLAGALVHELGHGVAAWLVGGTFESLQLFADGSGVALTRSPPTAWARAFVAAGGLFGPPIAGAMFFVAARDARLARAALVLLSLGLAAALVFWVRNGFGWAWVAACTGVTGWVAWRGTGAALQAFTCFLAVQACLSSLARTGYLFSAQAQTGAGEMASDTAQIAAQLGGPHWLWGALALLVSIAVMCAGLGLFLHALRRQLTSASA